MKPSNITILPELAAWFRNHKPEEAAKFEQNLKAAGTILDTIKWAGSSTTARPWNR